MRPQLLSFSGIRSYPGDVGPLDFTGKTLIAIIGDTGAGKSTILEAITLALYGNCTWTDREHKALMTQGATEMTVDFTFAHDGEQWRVRRAYHSNTTPSTHLLENLGTGEQTDGARAVNRKIEALLHLDFSSFTSAVLLPQGNFDRLLTATGGSRTALLRNIFGVEAIETIRARASRHHDQLTELIHHAELARHDLLDDPAGAAAEASLDSARAEHSARALHEALLALRTCRQQAADARDRHARLAAVRSTVEQRETRDIDSELAQIRAAVAELTALDTETAGARQDREGRRTAAREGLAAAARNGFTLESLASFATLLGGIPGRLDTLTAEQEQLDRDASEIAEQARQRADAETAVRDMQDTVGSLAENRTSAASTLEEYQQAHRKLQGDTTDALHKAVDAGRARRDEQTALRQSLDLRGAVIPLEAAADVAVSNLRSAEDELADVHKHDAAHALGEGLSPGQPCLVCDRLLQADYQPPAPADPAALQTAQRALRKAKDTDRKAANDLADMRGRAANARQEHEKRKSATQAAQARLHKARDEAVANMRRLASRQWGDGTGIPDGPLFPAKLEAACSQLSESEQDDAEALIGTSLNQLLSLARALEGELAAAVETASTAASNAEIDLARETERLSERRKVHHRAVARLASARKRHTNAVASISHDLTVLPGVVGQVLPAEPMAVTTSDVQAAQRLVSERREQLTTLTQHRDRATEELEKLAATQQQLDRRSRREVTDPLQAISTYLERWRETVDEAVSALPARPRCALMPAMPAEINEYQISDYATALAQADDAVRNHLSEAVSAAAKDADAQLRKLDDAAALLRTGQDEIHAVALPTGDQLLDPAALDPVIAAETSATELASRRRADQETAQGQIARAAGLDTAIDAGKARLSAIDALHGLLTDAKFPQYLTDRRTRALLGVATGIFRRLSGGEFGFAEDFQIVSIRSSAARSPKTLSGGETFLASLALALCPS